MSEKVLNQNSNGGVLSIHIKDGKIIRVRPMQIDPDELKPWKIVASNGKTYSPPKKVTANSYALTEKQRVYSADRILYPMKRVDFDPNGDRHPETRSKSKYVRIIWDEALDIVASEIKRIWKAIKRFFTGPKRQGKDIQEDSYTCSEFLSVVFKQHGIKIHPRKVDAMVFPVDIYESKQFEEVMRHIIE